MSFLHGRKKILVIGAVCSLIAAAGAYAYWTSTGGGTATATHETYEAITVNQTTVVAGLYPGGPAVTLSGTFSNPNQGLVRVAGVTVAFAATAITGSIGSPACTAADYELGGTASVGHEIAAGSNVDAWTGLTIRMLDSATNQDACKNATVNLVYSSN